MAYCFTKYDLRLIQAAQKESFSRRVQATAETYVVWYVAQGSAARNAENGLFQQPVKLTS